MEDFKDLIELQDKLEKMPDRELFEYVQTKYSDRPGLCYGKRKLIIRRVINVERELKFSQQQ